MRIGGVIVAIFSIALHTANCGGDRGISENSNNTRGALPNRSAFNSIPKENLAHEPVAALVTLCEYFNQDVGVISKVLDALSSQPQRRIDFLTDIRFAGAAGAAGVAANYNRNLLTLLQTVSADLIEACAADQENALNLLLRNRLLLFSAPPHFLLKLNNIYKALLLAYASVSANDDDDDKTNAFWRQQLPLTKRTWSKILLEPQLQSSLVVSLIKQRQTSGFFQVLEAVNLVELRDLLTTLDSHRTTDPTFFHSIDWNTAQIRTIVDFPFKRANSWSTWSPLYRHCLSRLLPVQIARISQSEVGAAAAVAVTHLQNVHQVSLPQALQLFKLVRSDEKTFKIDETNCALVAKLLYSQTNSFFAQLYNETLKMKIIKCLDSNKYSLLQAYHILGRNGLRDEKDYLLNLKGLMAAIPASFYINLAGQPRDGGSLVNHFTHVLKYLPSQANRVAASAAYQTCKTTIGASKCVESALENGNHQLVSMISPLDITLCRQQIWNLMRIKVQSDNHFEQRIVNWPTFVLTQLLLDEERVITYDQLFNETRPIRLIIRGLNCEILSRIPSSNWLPIFEFYNRQRRLYAKQFPKDLQKCAQRAFLHHLRTKSNTRVASASASAPTDADLVQFSDLADIRSIGGYVLATFPANSIVRSKYYRNIVEEIGRSSVAELMLAVTRRRLASIASQYLSRTVMVERDYDKILAEHLLTLGNLTHFLDEKFVRRVDAAALRLLLEAEFIDTRVCASSAIRKAWADKLIETFGSPETWDENAFLKIGDMLVVMEESSFDVMNVTACSRIADLIASKYQQSIEWIPKRLPFYKVCSVILPQHERPSYESSIKRLTLFYAASIEQLLDTTDVIVGDGAGAGADSGGRKPTAAAATQPEIYASNIPYVDSTSLPQLTEQTASAFIAGASLVASDSLPRNFDDVANDSAIVQFSPANDVPSAEESTEETDAAAAAAAVSTPTDENQSKDNSSPNSPVGSVNNVLHTTSETGAAAQTTTYSWLKTQAKSALRINVTNVVDQTDYSTRAISDPISTTISTVDSVPEESAQTWATVTVSADRDARNVLDASSTTATAAVVSTTAAETSTSTLTSSSSSSSTTTSGNGSDETTAWSPYTTAVFHSLGTNGISVKGQATVTDAIAIAIATATATATATETTTTTDCVHDDRKLPSSSPLPLQLPSEQNRYSSKVTRPPTTYSKAELRQILVDLLMTSSNGATRPKRDTTERKSEHSASKRRRSVSCNTLKMLDTMSDFILDSLQLDFEPEHTLDCVELLARLNSLSAGDKKQIWSDIESTLFDKNLTFVAGRILSVVETAALDELTYDASSPGALELIGALSSVYSSDNGRGARLVNKILKDNYDSNNMKTSRSKNRNKSLPVFTRALGKMICDVSNPMFFDLLKRDNMQADIWTMSMSDVFDDCPMECLSRIANVAVKVYGDPIGWQPSMFTMLGPVVAAIPSLHTYPNITRHFSALAFQCLRLSSEFSNANHDQQYVDGISLTSAMLLQEQHCTQTDGCSFASSLAAAELAEHSITSRANISHLSSLRSLVFIWFILKWFYTVPYDWA